MDVSPGDRNPEWPYAGFGGKADLRSRFSAVCGVSSDFLAPKPGFVHSPIRRLPLPVDASELVTLFEENRPDLLENALLAPSLKPTMDGAVIAKLFWQMIPLNTGTDPIDDRIEDRPEATSSTASPFGWISPLEYVSVNDPQGFRNLPNSRHIVARLSACHGASAFAPLSRFRIPEHQVTQREVFVQSLGRGRSYASVEFRDSLLAAFKGCDEPAPHHPPNLSHRR